jgi:NADH-quinone oxidoreductase subunit J
LSLDAILFYVFGALALLSALVVVGQRNPMYSAFALIVTLVSLSAVFGLLGATFIAALQVIVYAGAIMVLFLFVLMLLNVKAEDRTERGRGGTLRAAALGLGALLAAQVAVVLARAARAPGAMAAEFDAGSRRVAQVLFSVQYAYVFEATSVLILAALVGAVALAGRDHVTGKDL